MGVDFIGPLPESKNQDGVFNSITVVIDRLTAIVHLIPSQIDYKAHQVAKFIFEHIYKLHGLSKSIVSNQDSLFTSVFWKHLHQLIGTKLKMLSIYHPQIDGATDHANKTVTQMLQQCVNQHQTDWIGKLPAVEFATNSTLLLTSLPQPSDTPFQDTPPLLSSVPPSSTSPAPQPHDEPSPPLPSSPAPPPLPSWPMSSLTPLTGLRFRPGNVDVLQTWLVRN